MYPRPTIEAHEAQTLAPYACLSAQSAGRKYPEPADPWRTIFQRDRDRVLHTTAFLRLQGKTQVFMVAEGDHYRNRLTHTTEVQHISRDLARGLGLNEDLAETIALAHDLGHTPFGHAGQEALNQFMQGFGRHFEHNEQSLRVVEELASPYPEWPGLNLSLEVRDGLAKHTTVYDQHGRPQKTNTLEAQVVNLADEIAYSHHDLVDGLRAGYLDFTTMRAAVALIDLACQRVDQTYGSSLSPLAYQQRVLKNVIDAMITDVFTATAALLSAHHLTTRDDVRQCSATIVNFSPLRRAQVTELGQYLWHNVYQHPHVQENSLAGMQIIKALFEYYLAHPAALPPDQAAQAEADLPGVIKDYIAGMTDRYAYLKYQTFFPQAPVTTPDPSKLNDE